MQIFCTGCHETVEARLTDGEEMYPGREDLETMPFWKCDTCGAFVGTHMKSLRPEDHIKPLGYLCTKEVKDWRKRIHRILDPLWKRGRIKRGQAYAYISHRIGKTYHTGEIIDVEEGERIYNIVLALKEKIDPGPWNK